MRIFIMKFMRVWFFTT